MIMYLEPAQVVHDARQQRIPADAHRDVWYGLGEPRHERFCKTNKTSSHFKNHANITQMKIVNRNLTSD